MVSLKKLLLFSPFLLLLTSCNENKNNLELKSGNIKVNNIETLNLDVNGVTNLNITNSDDDYFYIDFLDSNSNYYIESESKYKLDSKGINLNISIPKDKNINLTGLYINEIIMNEVNINSFELNLTSNNFIKIINCEINNVTYYTTYTNEFTISSSIFDNLNISAKTLAQLNMKHNTFNSLYSNIIKSKINFTNNIFSILDFKTRSCTYNLFLNADLRYSYSLNLKCPSIDSYVANDNEKATSKIKIDTYSGYIYVGYYYTE